jgi:hypothetical protein
MQKSQCRNIRNMKKQGNMTPPKINNSTDTKDREEGESPDGTSKT